MSPRVAPEPQSKNSQGSPAQQQAMNGTGAAGSASNSTRARSTSLSSAQPSSMIARMIKRIPKAQLFVLNFALVGIFQGANNAYMVGVMSTLQRRFGFSGRVSGLIMIVDNIIQLFITPAIGYAASRYNRAKMIALGEFIVGVSTYLNAVPYLLYGSVLKSHMHDYHNGTVVVENMQETKYQLCLPDENLAERSQCIAAEASEDHIGGKWWHLAPGDHNSIAVLFFLAASTMNGLGKTAFYAIGLPYIDDNVKKKSSPLAMSTATAIRICGPALGYFLASFCLKYFEDPSYIPDFNRKDPQWIGAWWMGFFMLGSAVALCSLPMFLFPKSIRKKKAKPTDPDSEAPKATELDKGMKASTIRILTNPIFMFHLVGSVLRVNGIGGVYQVKPKYIELMYGQSASGASFLTGTTGILAAALGVFLGGVIITIFKPRPRPLLIYMFVVELVVNGCMFATMFLGCEPRLFPQTDLSLNNMDERLLNDCNRGCECGVTQFQPICDPIDSKSNYFSPCHAGCTSTSQADGKVSFVNCTCLEGRTAMSGYCPKESDCTQKLTGYVTVLAFGKLVASTARTGNALIILRSVLPQDKDLALSLFLTLCAVFGYIPYPTIFWWLIDQACLIWKKTCTGETANCWLYDTSLMNTLIHGTAFAFMTGGTLFDIGQIVLANRLPNLYEEEDERQPNEIEMADKKGSKASKDGPAHDTQAKSIASTETNVKS